MKKTLLTALFLMLLAAFAMAQNDASSVSPSAQGTAQAIPAAPADAQNAQNPAPSAKDAPADDGLSGMYSFLREGEFLQLSLEDNGSVNGILSRFADEAGTAFRDQSLKSGSFKDGRLSFRTVTVDKIWWEFTGTVVRGSGKTPDDESFRLLRGTLTRHTLDANQQDRTETTAVEFKSFPAEAAR
jgi:hypothetical protein